LLRQSRQEGRMFFFEKKNQKTFAIWHTWPISGWTAYAWEQEFFLF
jgi:hypothetical protein